MGSSSEPAPNEAVRSALTSDEGPKALNMSMLGLQAGSAFVAGFVASPLLNVSNKTTLPDITINEVLTKARKQPFLGAGWVSFRSCISSVRGAVLISVLSSAVHEKQHIDAADYCKSIFLGGLAETILAGVAFEIPETRIQSGFSRFSMKALNCFPFLLARNVLTTVSPAYVIMQQMNSKAEENERVVSPQKQDIDKDEKSSEKQKKQKLIALGTSAQQEQGSEISVYAGMLARTMAMSTGVAIAAAPFQGVVARVMQEQTITQAVQVRKPLSIYSDLSQC